MCAHHPPCPSAEAPDHAAARVVAHDYATGWSKLCNNVVVFDDGGELIDRIAVPPQRASYATARVAAIA